MVLFDFVEDGLSDGALEISRKLGGVEVKAHAAERRKCHADDNGSAFGDAALQLLEGPDREALGSYTGRSQLGVRLG